MMRGSYGPVKARRGHVLLLLRKTLRRRIGGPRIGQIGQIHHLLRLGMKRTARVNAPDGPLWVAPSPRDWAVLREAMSSDDAALILPELSHHGIALALEHDTIVTVMVEGSPFCGVRVKSGNCSGRVYIIPSSSLR